MRRFEALLRSAHIDVVDMHHEIELNGVLVYFEQFPHGDGRLLLNPALAGRDPAESVAVVAHELAHKLLALVTDHPTSVLELLYDPTLRSLYNRYEAEADCLAACLLVPAALRAACPSPLFPSVRHLARALGVPVKVVRRAQAHPEFDLPVIHELLLKLTGQPDFAPLHCAVALPPSVWTSLRPAA